MNNKTIGNIGEQATMDELRRMGWWCHRFAQSVQGQPCDIIAVKDGEIWLLDAKHITKPSFSMERIEPNQATAFFYAGQFGIKCGLALVFAGKVWLLKWDDALEMAKTKASAKVGDDRIVEMAYAL